MEILDIKKLENDIWTPQGWKRIKRIGKKHYSNIEVNLIKIEDKEHYLLDEEEIMYSYGIFSPAKDIKQYDALIMFDDKRNLVKKVVDEAKRVKVSRDFYFIELMPNIQCQSSYEPKGFDVLYDTYLPNEVREKRYSQKKLTEFKIGDYIKTGDVFCNIKSIYLDKDDKTAYIITDNNENSFITNGLVKRNVSYVI